MPRERIYKYVRSTSNGLFQARPWDGRYRRHINLGCYTTERAAWDACKRYAKTGEIPPQLLPAYVRTCGDRIYSACIIHRGKKIRVGPYLFPEAAQDGLLQILRRRFPKSFANFRDPIREQRELQEAKSA